MKRTQTFLVISLLTAAGTALAGCGSNGATPAPAAALTQSPGARAGGGLAGGLRTPPGAFGLVAAVSASKLEVQNPQTGQTTVSFNAKTTFTRTESAALADVTVGVCVTAIGQDAASGGAFTARSVEITAPVKGSCARRGGSGRGGDVFGGGGFGGSGRPSGRPTRFPTARPSGSAGFRGGSSVVGKVTAVTGGGFTVDGFLRTGRRGFSPRPVASPTATPTPTTVTVTVNSATTYDRTVAATHKALKVGACVAALGPADDTGAVTANSITISPPVNGTCFSGFGRRFGAGPANG